MATLTERQEELCTQSTWDFSDLIALYVNCTLKPPLETSNTQGLMDISMEIMRRNEVTVDLVRAVDHDIAPGVWPDMTEHGAASDEWPELYERVRAADILVIGSPIWLGENRRWPIGSSNVSTHAPRSSTRSGSTPTTGRWEVVLSPATRMRSNMCR